MIYLFSHLCEEIDGVYQSHPVRTISTDPTIGRFWALNPIQNSIYTTHLPNQRAEISKSFQDEEIFLDFPRNSFEPMFLCQSKRSIGLIDAERNLFRLYAKTDRKRLISSYENVCRPQWKMTDGLVFQDDRILLRLTDQSDGVKGKTNFGQTIRRRLIELTADGEEKREIEANSVYSMTLGPNDELILGFAVRGDRGLIHCY